MNSRVTEGAKRERHDKRESLPFFFSQLPAAVVSFVSSTLARTCTPITKSGEKERLLAVYVLYDVLLTLPTY